MIISKYLFIFIKIMFLVPLQKSTIIFFHPRYIRDYKIQYFETNNYNIKSNIL